MKKIAFVLVSLTVFSTTVFATPGSLSAPLDNSRSAGSGIYAIGALNAGIVSQTDDLFADVGAVQLTDTEALAVEGEGVFGLAIGGLLGGITGMLIGKIYAVYTGGVFYSNTCWNYGAMIGMSFG